MEVYEMSIDHEAAKTLAESMVRTHTNPNDVPATVLSVNISEAYIDLHEQLAAERARVDALAELVEEAFHLGVHLGYKGGGEWGDYNTAKSKLDSIMEGRTNA